MFQMGADTESSSYLKPTCNNYKRSFLFPIYAALPSPQPPTENVYPVCCRNDLGWCSVARMNPAFWFPLVKPECVYFVASMGWVLSEHCATSVICCFLTNTLCRSTAGRPVLLQIQSSIGFYGWNIDNGQGLYVPLTAAFYGFFSERSKN